MKATDRQGREWLLSREDRDLLTRYTWHVSRSGSYVVARDPATGAHIRFHRLVAERVHGNIDGRMVDHRNGNPRDNRRSNLRPATRPENARNRRKTQKPTRTKYIGVFKEGPSFFCRVAANGATRLGPFTTEVDAARARDRQARKAHGRFASLNFPQAPKSCPSLRPVPPPAPKQPPQWMADHYQATDSKKRKWRFSRDDLDIYDAHTWHVWTHPKQKSYVRAGVAGGKDRRFHRLVLERIFGSLRSLVPDHRDGDGTNNRRDNLRVATYAQNNQNRGKWRRGTRSRHKGVDYHPLKKRYLAYIQIASHKCQLGTYKLEKAAAVAYDLAAQIVFGEFALTNFRDSRRPAWMRLRNGEQPHLG